MRIRREPSSSRCWEPVTVPAAPRNVSVAVTRSPALRLADARRPHREDARAGREVEDLLGGAVDTRADQRRQIESGFRHDAFLAAHPGPRVPGYEERAAVRIGLDGDLEGPEGARLIRDLELVHADERPQDRQICSLVDAP